MRPSRDELYRSIYFLFFIVYCLYAKKNGIDWNVGLATSSLQRKYRHIATKDSP